MTYIWSPQYLKTPFHLKYTRHFFLESAAPSWCLYIYSFGRDKYIQCNHRGLNALLKGPKQAPWNTTSTTILSSCFYFYLSLFISLGQTLLTFTIYRHLWQFVPLLLFSCRNFPMTISSRLVIWPRPHISPGTLKGLSMVMWLSLPSNKRLLYDMGL